MITTFLFLFFTLSITFSPLPSMSSLKKVGITAGIATTATCTWLAVDRYCFSPPKQYPLPFKLPEKWEEIDVHDLFPLPPLMGVALSEYQNSGSHHLEHSNWAHWENKKKFSSSQKVSNHWEEYKRDVAHIKEIESNGCRFSIDWSIIEPQEGVFNEKALERYVSFCKHLVQEGITPMATLHHFSHPQWFEEKGGFLLEENTSLFVSFCEKVFDALSPYVNLWITINEPGPFVFQGYIHGAFPPGQTNPARAARVLKNLLFAHCKVYDVLKKKKSDAQIGIAHNVCRFYPASTIGVLEKFACSFMNYVFNDVIMKFLTTGTYNFYYPLFINVSADYGKKPPMDFIGLNYYSRVVLGFTWGFPPLKPTCFEGEEMTQMPYAPYPEGFYGALCEVKELGVPVFVTENGIAVDHEEKRELFFKKHLYILSKAIKYGHDVRGYFCWTLNDNFEWDMGFTKRFGLYSFDPETGTLEMRKSTRFLSRIIAAARAFVPEGKTEI